MDYFDAINAIYEQNDIYDGIGFMLSNDDNYIVLDIDNAIDENGQIISDLALEMVELTYCEKSPSGTGLHCFFKGYLPSERKKKRTDLDIELYDTARFMTVIQCDDQEVLNNLYVRFLNKTNQHKLLSHIILMIKVIFLMKMLLTLC